MLKPLLAGGPSMLKTWLVVVAVAGTASSAGAWEFRTRFVERIGNTDSVIDPRFFFVGFTAHRLRIQFGVFDNAEGPAPAGGFIGWNVGAITPDGGTFNVLQTRTPGRLSPFNFATQPGANGNPPLPGGDPFVSLTDIDATLGTQSPPWMCTPGGQVPPQPSPVIRARNTFVSLFEITIDAAPGALPYDLQFSGNLIAATEWRTVGTSIPPDCGDPADPADDIPGSVVYAPFPTAPIHFSSTIFVYTEPSPGSVPAFLIAAGALVRRRRP